MADKVQGVIDSVYVLRDPHGYILGLFVAPEDVNAEQKKHANSTFRMDFAFIFEGAEGLKAWPLQDGGSHALNLDNPQRLAREKEQERLQAVAMAKLTRAECEVLGLTKVYHWKKTMFRWQCEVPGAVLVVESIRMRGDRYNEEFPYEWCIKDGKGEEPRWTPERTMEDARLQVERCWETRLELGAAG